MDTNGIQKVFPHCGYEDGSEGKFSEMLCKDTKDTGKVSPLCGYVDGVQTPIW